MLPVLKEAGVVDSGGQGLLEVLRGAMDGFLGKEVDYSSFAKPAAPPLQKSLRRQRQILNLAIVQSLLFSWIKKCRWRKSMHLRNF